jgi:hypothetical protein
MSVKDATSRHNSTVVAGLDPAIHRSSKESFIEWMRGSSSAKTRFALSPAHDRYEIRARNITKRLATHTAVKHRDQLLHLKPA